jgi:hypothetical protein
VLPAGATPDSILAQMRAFAGEYAHLVPMSRREHKLGF